MPASRNRRQMIEPRPKQDRGSPTGRLVRVVRPRPKSPPLNLLFRILERAKSKRKTWRNATKRCVFNHFQHFQPFSSVFHAFSSFRLWGHRPRLRARHLPPPHDPVAGASRLQTAFQGTFETRRGASSTLTWKCCRSPPACCRSQPFCAPRCPSAGFHGFCLGSQWFPMVPTQRPPLKPVKNSENTDESRSK